MAGLKDGQTLIHMTLLAIAMGQTSTTTIDWHLKVKDIACNVDLPQNYCIIISMQKISSYHKINF